MPLSNAERQERYRQRLKDRANSPSEMLRAACVEWLDEVEKEWREEQDSAPDEGDLRLVFLRNQVQAQTDLGDHFAYMVDSFMSERLRRVRLPKPARARRLKPAARS